MAAISLRGTPRGCPEIVAARRLLILPIQDTPVRLDLTVRFRCFRCSACNTLYAGYTQAQKNTRSSYITHWSASSFCLMFVRFMFCFCVCFFFCFSLCLFPRCSSGYVFLIFMSGFRAGAAKLAGHDLTLYIHESKQNNDDTTNCPRQGERRKKDGVAD